MSDLMSYPGAAGLLAADPGEVSALASLFHTVASQAGGARTGLQGAHGDATWTGVAADAFRTKLGKLPSDLSNVERSYGDVATALDSYETQLGPLQNQFVNILGQINNLQGSLTTAQGNLSTAQGNLTSATNAPNAKPTSTAVVNAHNAVQTASGAVSRLQGEISGLEGRGRQILDEFNTARGHAKSAVSGAAGYAPQESWWSSVMGAVGNFLKGVAVGIGTSVWALVSGKAIADFIEHPSWSTFGALLKDVAVTASLVAMIAAPFAAPELLEADAAGLAGEDIATDAAGDALADATTDATADGAEDSTEGAATETETETETESKSFGDYARGANTWGNRVATVATGGQAVTDGASGHWEAALLDVGFMAAPNLIGGLPKSFSIDSIRGFSDDATNALHVGDAQADAAADVVKGLNENAGNLSFYRFLRGFDISPELSQKIAFTDGLPEGLTNVDLDSGAAIKAAANSANETAASTAARSLHIGKPLAYGIDNLVVDPTHDAINHHYHLVPDGG
jgi:hypothetical protein